jgi:uncharacterized protein (DUF1919 family)/GT2 family glycosyltransferase
MQRSRFFVTVIIPVYNGERFLAGAVENVLKQNYDPLEIIIVDDGSTDGTALIASTFKHCVRYYYQPNRGPAAARNLGIKEARGDVIAFQDVDDLWPVNKLRHQMSCLEKDPSVEIVQGLIQTMELDASAPPGELVFEETSAPYQFISLNSAVYRHSVFDKVGLLDEMLRDNEDTDWFIRAWENNVTKVVLDQVALFYRKHDRNMSRQQDRCDLQLVRLFKKHLDRCRSRVGLSTTKRLERPSIADYIGSTPILGDRSRVKDQEFTIISNDCWGGGAYGHLGLAYRTPFVGTRVFAPCFIRLLRDPKRYIESSMRFISNSIYKFMNEQREKDNDFYPIGLLNNEVEIHFLHEYDESEARLKWDRRVGKINWNNLFVKFSEDQGLCTRDHICEFDQLEVDYKVCFTFYDYSYFRSTITMREYFNERAPMYFLSRKYFDSISWLSKEHGSDTQAYKLQPGRSK